MGILNKLTPETIRLMFPNAGTRLDPHLPYIIPAMQEFGIDNDNRVAAFLAQLAHESGEYRYMEEIADGSDYEGREDLGNTNYGDGRRYKGHGPIQITGKTNHRLCGMALDINLLEVPTLITQPKYGTRSAGWFWKTHDLNLIADRNWFITITKTINGGTNGLAERITYWNRNRQILGLTYIDVHTVEQWNIQAFQKQNGLGDDGIAGPKTIAKLKQVA